MNYDNNEERIRKLCRKLLTEKNTQDQRNAIVDELMCIGIMARVEMADKLTQINDRLKSSRQEFLKAIYEMHPIVQKYQGLSGDNES